MIEPFPLCLSNSFAPLFRNDMILRRALALALLLISLGGVWAQRPGGWGGQRPAIGKVYGKVLDATTKKGVEFATVSLLSAAKDSVVGGALAESNGDFAIDKLPFGAYRLRIAFLGYATFERAVQVTPDHVEQDLGNLLLEAEAVTLKAAEVTAERSQTQLQVDRRVYNVEKDLSVRGGTGVDVMKNVPGLTVDADDNVQLRNATPQIFINGRPTTLLLEQIPADDIERVEVITNPGAAFDASSGGGIINVVLKKSTRPGYNGQVQVSLGTNGRYGGNANLNVKDGRWNFAISGNLGHAENNTVTTLHRDSYQEGALVERFDQRGNTDNTRENFGGRLGVEYQVSNRSTISLSGSPRARQYENADDLHYTDLDGGGALVKSGTQTNDGTNRGNEYNVQGGFRHKTPVEGREWSTDLTYNRSDRTNASDYLTNTLNAVGEAFPGSARAQRSTGTTKGDQFTWQFDMTDPRKSGDKLEYGARSNVRLERSLLEVLVGTDTSATRTDPALSNDYRITDIVNAGYLNWTHKLSEHWGVMAGLRVEQTWFQADVRDPADASGRRQVFSYRYPDGTKELGRALFPSVFISRKWEGTRELQFNFSRKINRPNFFQVMPFIMFSDTRNVRVGNPALAPEIIDLAEANHLLPFANPRSNWLTSAFVRHTAGVITGYAYPSPTDSSVLINTFVNGNDAWTYGWENTVKLEISRGAQVTFGGTAQFVEIGANTAGGRLRNNGWQFNAKANFNMRLPKDWSVQVNGEYEGRRLQPQGYAVPNGGVDVSVSKDLTKHWTAQLTVNDVFYSRLWGTVLETPVLYQESERRRELRFLRATLTWKFGEQDASLFRKRNQSQKRDPGANTGEGDF